MARKKVETTKKKRGRPPKPKPYVEHRGGKREGSGRKPYVADEDKRVRVVLTISPESKARCLELHSKGVNLSAEFEKVVTRLAKVLCSDANK